MIEVTVQPPTFLVTTLIAFLVALLGMAFSPQAYATTDIGYQIQADYADQRVPRLYTHRLLLGSSGSLLSSAEGAELLYFNVNLGVAYRSLDNRILSDGGGGGNDNVFSQTLTPTDVDVALGRLVPLGWWGNTEHAVDFSAGNTFPASRASRFEGVASIPSVSLTFLSAFWDGRVRLSNGLSGSYIFNSYKYSPFNNEINPDIGSGYALSASLLAITNFRFTVGTSLRSTHYLDGTHLESWNNFQDVSYSVDRWVFSARYDNGGHTDAEYVELGHLDRYRRMLTLGVHAAF